MHTLISYTQPSGVEATQCNAEFLLPLLCVLRERVCRVHRNRLASHQEQLDRANIIHPKICNLNSMYFNQAPMA